jgi:hypothetical protein
VAVRRCRGEFKPMSESGDDIDLSIDKLGGYKPPLQFL